MANNGNSRDLSILEKLEEIISEGEVLNDQAKKYGNPKDYLEMANIVFDFIKKKGLILYGGEAIDKNLKNAKQPGIYSAQSKPDYDFYSFDYEKDSIELCNILHDKGYKYVRRIPRMHRGTFAVQANTANIADITYVPKNIFDKIPVVKINGVKYIDNLYTIKNLYLGLVRPKLSANYARWEKDWERLQLMNEIFPIPATPTTSNVKSALKLSKKTEDAIQLVCKQFVYRNPQVVVTGRRAVQFMQGDTETGPLELVSVDSQAENHVKMIQKLIPKTSVEVYAPFLGDLPTRLRIKMNDETIADIYSIEHECVATVKSESGTYYSNYYYLMHFLLSQYFYFSVYPEYSHQPNQLAIVSNLQKKRDEFLKTHKLDGFEAEAKQYRVLDSQCVGTQKSDPEITREQQLAGIQQYPRYYPEFEYIDVHKVQPSIVPPNYDGKLVKDPPADGQQVRTGSSRKKRI